MRTSLTISTGVEPAKFFTLRLTVQNPLQYCLIIH
nr:MAG TPA: hypothetical protein [Caudoviricetes sp.]